MAGAWNLIGWGVLLCLCSLTSEAQNKQRTPVSQGRDCSHIKSVSPGASSGVYFIQPPGVRSPFQVYCEMRSDGGWTVFQKRSGGHLSFRRNWKEYKWGFGDLRGDHWLGLQRVWELTRGRRRRSVLRVDLWDFEGGAAFAEYADFKLGSEASAYRLSVSTYRGTAGDAIRGAYSGIDQAGAGFSTEDRDHDGCSPCIFGDVAVDSCSREEGGAGWWFSRCGSASLNGDWHPRGSHLGWASGLHWLTWRGPAPYSARATRMMVRTL
ncbi:angiopoietin-4-like [Lepisosteus oculatus]|uniref:angiopoietin-4-like n=1 Tax=Lepisosteus oculatus TaxID=7918 RepID=UPI00371631B1